MPWTRTPRSSARKLRSPAPLYRCRHTHHRSAPCSSSRAPTGDRCCAGSNDPRRADVAEGGPGIAVCSAAQHLPEPLSESPNPLAAYLVRTPNPATTQSEPPAQPLPRWWKVFTENPHSSN
ncbi:hypothetical protein E2562_000246 [Oryza meyeriana var. granulata]|uniref:Uncharacterized protein n=1 Tax=Oryza meyeriana var. granulata TaxID=110450 RepID=A0A6G1CNZ5_9ORYZ|nr:hypothetical protein E2562_000246 [Oryza meyeriana var. granulata]